MYVCEREQILSKETLHICCEKRIDALLILMEKMLFSVLIFTLVLLVESPKSFHLEPRTLWLPSRLFAAI